MKRRTLFAVLLATAACGDDPKDDQFPPPSSEALCAVNKIVCERQAECGIYVLSPPQADVDACIAELDCEAVAIDAAENKIAIDVDTAKACEEELRTASCEELLPWVNGSATQLFSVSEHCPNIFVGSASEGESCTQSAECGAGLNCAGETCPGTCEAGDLFECEIGECGAGKFCNSSGCEPIAEAGQACRISERENSCAAGTFCIASPDGGTCQPQIEAGQSCSQGGFFACAGERVCIDNICAEPLAVGVDCTSADDCGLTGYCDFNGDQTCLQAKSLGQSCSGTLFGECGDYLCTDGICALRSTDPIQVRETKEFVGDGADCSDANCGPGLVCWPNADVSQHRCQPKFKGGESCEPETAAARFDVLLSIASVTSCETGLCDITSESWTCVEPGAPGESCSRPGTLSLECQSAICGGNGKCEERFPDQCP